MKPTTAEKTCPAYDQISDRKCRFYAGHGGRHNFARLDHDYSLERDLRRQLDEMTRARDEACRLTEWALERVRPGDAGEIAGKSIALTHLTELRKVGAP